MLMDMIRIAAVEMQKETPVFEITVGMLKPSACGTARLKAKAAESRYLLPLVLWVLRHLVSHDDDHARLRLQCVEALARAYDELDN